MTTVMRHVWTYEDYLALPESGPIRYEIFDGELSMTPSPNTRHQEISWNLSFAFGAWLKKNPGGKSFTAPYDVIFSTNPLQYVEPDLVYVSKERLSIITGQNIQGIPDLIVEICSPATEKKDRKEKFALYQRFGVPEYWIVDPETETVQVFRWRDGHYTLAEECRGEDHLASPLLPGLSIPAREIFAT